MTDSVDGLRSQLLMELFGRCDTSTLSFHDLTLPLHPVKALSAKKLKSLAKKYFSIPVKYLKYYPRIEKEAEEVSENKNNGSKRSRKSVSEVLPKAKRRVGKPKKAPIIIHGLQSVTKYFRPVQQNRS